MKSPRMTIYPRRLAVEPGAQVRFRLHLANRLPRTASVRLYKGPNTDGWEAHLPADHVEIPHDSALTLFLRVRAPAQSRTGDRQNFLVVGRTLQGGRRSRMEVEVVVAERGDGEGSCPANLVRKAGRSWDARLARARDLVLRTLTHALKTAEPTL